MEFKKGDLVTRISHKHDCVFKILNIDNNIAYLKGENVRLYADSPLKDLKKYLKDGYDSFEKDLKNEDISDRGDYFYLPPRILQVDGDQDYLNRCLNYYKKNKLQAIGKVINENEIPLKILKLLKEYEPGILIITGHDAYYEKNGSKDSNQNYKNSKYFCEAVKIARKYEKNPDKLVIIAGACQSNYEELIKCGSNFASSPKRVNIHALDPAIIATTIALTKRDKTIDLINLLNKTKYGSDGIGGVICNGLMYVGYPR